MSAALTTGLDVVNALRQAAAARNVTVTELLRPITKDASKWLSQVARAHRPTAETINRVQALLSGDAVTPSRIYRRIEGPGSRMVRMVPRVTSQLDLPDDWEPVDRDPCFRCGTRGDIGCAHRGRQS